MIFLIDKNAYTFVSQITHDVKTIAPVLFMTAYILSKFNTSPPLY